MVTGSFNGWSVVALPTSPAFAQVSLAMSDTVAANVSPWTSETQLLDWMADHWELTASLPPMSTAQAGAWSAFLGELRGMAGAFLVGDPTRAKPQGHPSGAPYVAGVGSNVSRSATVATSGWLANASRLLLPGDHIQLGMRLHMVLDTVNADGSGNATINIWPRLREVTFGGKVITANAQGLFRLADNKRGYSVARGRSVAISIQATEAL